MLVVCAAIIYKGDKILIAQRKEDDRHALLWEFPGGKVEEGESSKEAVVREIKEELDINIAVGKVFDVIHHKYDRGNIILIVYECRYESGETRAIECNDFKWVTLSEIDKYEFTEADKFIVDNLLNKN